MRLCLMALSLGFEGLYFWIGVLLHPRPTWRKEIMQQPKGVWCDLRHACSSEGSFWRRGVIDYSRVPLSFTREAIPEELAEITFEP
jgi:hypothetical protein